MKKIILLAAAFVTLHASAQVKEGMIRYIMTLESGDNAKANPMLGNSELVIYFKNDKTLAQMNTSILSMKTVTNNGSILILTDVAGQKFFIRKTKEELAKEKANVKSVTPTVIITKEKKKILGYECTKALVTMGATRGQIPQMTIWFTDNIKNVPAIGMVSENINAQLKGMALEIDGAQGTVRSKIVAKEISLKPVPDAVFNPSTAGYTESKKGGMPMPGF